MRRFRRVLAGATTLGLLGAAGCRDEVPTIVDPNEFPGGVRNRTVEITLPASEVLVADTVYSGFTGPADLGALLVAHRFGAVGQGPLLEAHTLARFTAPDSVTYVAGGANVTTAQFAYAGGQLVAVLQRPATRIDGPVQLRVFEIAQEWDAASATWTHAVNTAATRTPWQQPGGTRGAAIATLTITPGDTAQRDTLRWAVDSVTMSRLAAPGARGVLIEAEGAAARIQLSALSLNARIRPSTRPDTVLDRTFGNAGQRYVFTPEPPRSGVFWRVGGVESARTVLTLRLPATLPACAPGTPGGCGTVPTGSVLLNQAALLLRPARVADGFQPVSAPQLQLRRITEPELGAQAPLGGFVAIDSVPARAFTTGADTTVALLIAPDFVRQLTTSATRTATLALIADPEGRTFGVARFSRDARVRLVYTIVSEPTLP